eukprot:m.69991 g.69991  ORF g.69991 m.69991 type:complete len:178 (-) comp11657_c0_seq2:1216-1749(-)
MRSRIVEETNTHSSSNPKRIRWVHCPEFDSIHTLLFSCSIVVVVVVAVAVVFAESFMSTSLIEPTLHRLLVKRDEDVELFLVASINTDCSFTACMISSGFTLLVFPHNCNVGNISSLTITPTKGSSKDGLLNHFEKPSIANTSTISSVCSGTSGGITCTLSAGGAEFFLLMKLSRDP